MGPYNQNKVKKRLRKEADKLWYQKYLKPACEICGSTGIRQAHHFFYKGSYGHLRYSEDNCITLCMGCHFTLHSNDPKKIEQIIIERKGKVWYNRITKLSKEKHYSFQTIGWYRENIERLKSELDSSSMV